jgi:AsmA protein
MRRIVKWIGIFLAVLVVAVVSLPFFINVNQFRPTLETELTSALGREVKLGSLQLQTLAGEVTANDLSVAEDPAFGRPAFLRAKSLHIGVELWPFLLSRKLIVTNLTLDQPDIALAQAPSGDWNFSSVGGKSRTALNTPPPKQPVSASTPLDLSVKLVKVTNGRLTLSRTVGHWKPLVLEQANIELRDFSSDSAFPFTLSTKIHGGGALELKGKAGPINPTDTAMTPVSVSLSVAQLDLAGSGANDMAPDIAGLVSFAGSGESDGKSMQLNGKLKADQLKLAAKGSPATRPLEFDFAVQHDLRKHSGRLRQGDIHIGSALARLTGTYAEQGEAMTLNLKLAGSNMPLQELQSLLPALGVALPAGSSLQGGVAGANFSMEGPADRLVTSGSLAVNNTRLTGFDLARKMASIEKLAGIKADPDTDIQTFSASVRVGPEGANVRDLKLIVPALGDLSGAGDVSPTNALDFKMSAIVHTSGLLAVVGNTPIPFTVGGTCSEPVFRPDIKAVAKEEVKSLVEGNLGKAAGGLLKGLLGGKKQN